VEAVAEESEQPVFLLTCAVFLFPFHNFIGVSPFVLINMRVKEKAQADDPEKSLERVPFFLTAGRPSA
jgi:hypothetical protein